jgi:hypothetical protein
LYLHESNDKNFFIGCQKKWVTIETQAPVPVPGRSPDPGPDYIYMRATIIFFLLSIKSELQSRGVRRYQYREEAWIPDLALNNVLFFGKENR